jgi:RyR domain
VASSTEAVSPGGTAYQQHAVHQWNAAQTLLDASMTDGQSMPETSAHIAFAYLDHLIVHPEAIVEVIHDLWAGQRLTEGYAYTKVSDPSAKVSALLVPFAALPDPVLELELARGDVRAISEALHVRFPRLEHGRARTAAEISRDERAAIPAVMCALAQDDECIDIAGRSAHETWRRLQHQLGVDDPRIRMAYDDMPDHGRQRTRSNIRLDMLAVALSVLA